ncbi:helix-turn-helix domain-containing protein [Aliiruegeria sabulilitoris]|uniref:helix-turn-helix domain-containing protein n=1 Tax=Aliiruegeria sabulilitoris TaxID=1510458 RepID=UPI000835737F|nr:helix-turn-helix domain-containing protein [Aliiruegeria sabulilitoris]NDR56666.1 helix-turn-helix domain-containing protein [Pseudoruegeria sp. M32A2M]
MNVIDSRTDRTSQVIQARVFEPLAKASPVLEAHQTQLGIGPYKIDAVVGRAQETWLIRNRVDPLSVGHVVPDPNLLAFVVPVAWRGEYLCNGISASASTLYIASGPDGYSTRGAGRDYFTIGLSRDRFVRSLAALEGVEPGEIHLHDGALYLPPLSMIRMRRILGACLAELSAGSGCHHNRQAAIAECLYDVMLEAYLAGTPLTSMRVPLAKSYERIVRTAEEHFMEAEGAPLSLADLCRATGVGRTVFYEAFNSVYGTSPLNYFKKRRLMQARTALATSRPDETKVKEVALSLGLTHLGRFSTEYRNLFGETPSVTLSSPDWSRS